MRRHIAATALVLALGAPALALAQAPTPVPAARPSASGGLLGPGDAPRGASAATTVREGQPVETVAPNNKVQKPAFTGQTRAPSVRTKTPIEVRTVFAGLKTPWGMAFLPDGRVLISDRDGSLRIIDQNGSAGPVIAGPPNNFTGGDSGVDVVLDPDFRSNRVLFVAFVEQRTEGGTGVSLAKAELAADDSRLENLSVVFRAQASPVSAHFGGRLSIGPDGYLYLAVGARFTPANRIKAQNLDSHWGKVLRLTSSGAPAPGNPFAHIAAAQAEIWTYGMRNPQGLAWQPGTGALWESEHGQQGGDEINILHAGHNYGWPIIAYGLEYNNSPINQNKSQQAGMDQPVYYYDPVISPSGIAFYSGKLVPEWRGNLFAAGLAGRHLARLVIRNDKVVGEERLLADRMRRIRHVAEGPDGALWVLEDGRGGPGDLLRLAPER